uniref:Uncharacterized protein n=1 Tax=Setaria italica TaxID=4555 RepID=K3XTZ1_SETIT
MKKLISAPQKIKAMKHLEISFVASNIIYYNILSKLLQQKKAPARN